MQDFLSLDNLENFTYLMFVVVVATEFTKRLIGKQSKIKTDYLVFFYALILSILKTLAANDKEYMTCKDVIIGIILILINALIISYFSSAGYSKIKANIDEDNRNKAIDETIQEQKDRD